jgi:hypothetical protein
MAGALVYGLTTGTGFGTEGSALLDLAWGRVTVIDLYLMLAIFAAWIWRREPNRMVAAMWTVGLLSLGSLAAGVYLVRAASHATSQPPSA